jgi:hypothetical protein
MEKRGSLTNEKYKEKKEERFCNLTFICFSSYFGREKGRQQ